MYRRHATIAFMGSDGLQRHTLGGAMRDLTSQGNAALSQQLMVGHRDIVWERLDRPGLEHLRLTIGHSDRRHAPPAGILAGLRWRVAAKPGLA
jgi:hypothetical protein